MRSSEISRQLAEIKLGVIAVKTKFKMLVEDPQWGEFIDKEKDGSEELLQGFSSVINQLTILEKNFPNLRFLWR